MGAFGGGSDEAVQISIEDLAIARPEVFDKGRGYGFVNEMDGRPAESAASHSGAEVSPGREVETGIDKKVEFRTSDLIVVPEGVVTRTHQRRQFLGVASLEGSAKIGDTLPFGHGVPGSPKEALAELVAVLLNQFKRDLAPGGGA